MYILLLICRLPLTSAPPPTVPQDVGEELERVTLLYEVYSEQRAFAEMNSNMLWADMDIGALESGSEDLVQKVRKMPKALKDMSTYHAVAGVVTAFREGIPLIASLKNEAMKDRHWSKLMDVTGVKFTMNPKTFTLNKLFEMNLARFGDEIAEIVNESMQELKIEKEIRSVGCFVFVQCRAFPPPPPPLSSLL